jgi:hypothetical protein
MKNKYFGDNRDLFKFDVAQQIMQSNLVKHFSYIPVLTSNDTGNAEDNICREEALGGAQNAALLDFLNKAIINDERDIRQLEKFFQDNGLKINIYRTDTLFTHEGRKEYLQNIGAELLTKSLVLVDPDFGVTTEDVQEDSLTLGEIKDLYDRMDMESILMFIQHFSLEYHDEFTDLMCREIREYVTGRQPISIDDNTIMLFFLTKNRFIEGLLVNLMKDYVKKLSERNLNRAG